MEEWVSLKFTTRALNKLIVGGVQSMDALTQSKCELLNC